MSSGTVEDYRGIDSRQCLRGNPHAFPGNPHGQDLGATLSDGLGDTHFGVGFNEEHDTAAAASSANFGAKTSLPTGYANQFVDEGRGNPRSIGPPQLPLRAEQTRDLVPVAAKKRFVHGTRDLGNLLEVAEDMAVAVDVGLEDFPVIDAGLPRGAGVGKHKAGLDFFRLHGNGLAVDAIDVEVNGADPAIESGIVVLATGGHVDELRFNILSDDAHLLETEAAAGEPGEGRGGCNHEGGRTGDAGSSG